MILQAQRSESGPAQRAPSHGRVAKAAVALVAVMLAVALTFADAAAAADLRMPPAAARGAAPSVSGSAGTGRATSPTPPLKLLNALGTTARGVSTTQVATLSELAASRTLVFILTDVAQGWVAAVTRAGAILAAPYRPQGAVTVPLPFAESTDISGVSGLLAVAGTRGIAVADTSGVSPSAAAASGSSNSWSNIGLIAGSLFLLVFLGAAVFLRRASSGGASMSSIRSHARIRATSKVSPSRVRFCDVAGVNEAVEELRETVDFLKAPERFSKAGARMPRGVILYGPPGTGKTMLASAISGEASVPFFSLSGSEFVESLVGVGASRVRDLFATARKSKTGAVIFIDELDAVGRRRGGINSGNDERESTLNQLLVELDGFTPRERIVVIAATNRVDLLDEALTRPGRFDRHISVSLPAERGRRAILAVHAANKHLSDDADLDHIAAISAGFSGADLAKLVNEAAIMSVRASRAAIDNCDLTEGMLRVVAGPEKKDRALARGELERIAWHEAGHTLAAYLCPTHPKVMRMSILARGMTAGMALFGDADTAMLTAQALHERMIVALAGRAAEQVRFASISSGAANDLEHVNRLARNAVERLGFAPQVGQIVASLGEIPVILAERTRQSIDSAVGEMVDQAYAQALSLLTEHRAQLDLLATTVLEREQLDRAELSELLTQHETRRTRSAPDQVRALPTDRSSAGVVGEPDPTSPDAGVPARLRPGRARARLAATRTDSVAARRNARRAMHCATQLMRALPRPRMRRPAAG